MFKDIYSQILFILYKKGKDYSYHTHSRYIYLRGFCVENRCYNWLRLYGVFEGSVSHLCTKKCTKNYTYSYRSMFKGIDSNIQFRLAPQDTDF